RADEAAFRNRRIDDALGTELVEEAARDLEGAAEDGDVLAQKNDVAIAPHLVAQRLRNRFEVGDDGHQSANTRAATVAGSGSGSDAASVTACSTVAAHSSSIAPSSAAVHPPGPTRYSLKRRIGSRRSQNSRRSRET